jgi:uncharacterized protein (DUF302 family)
MGVSPKIDGLILQPSSHNPVRTMERLVSAVTKRGMTVMARIDHAAGAAGAEMTLRPTALLIFGNAHGGTPLMQSAQTMGIDLPLKALVFEDEDRKTWIAYNDPHWLAARHHIAGTEAVLASMTNALAAIVQEAA